MQNLQCTMQNEEKNSELNNKSNSLQGGGEELGENTLIRNLPVNRNRIRGYGVALISCAVPEVNSIGYIL